MRLIIFLCILYLTPSIGLSQNFTWGATQGGNSGDYANECITDLNGNIYYIGEFRNTMDMDPGASVVNKTSFAYSDMYIIKLDMNHNFLWMKHLGGPSYDIAKKIAFAPNGDLIVMGAFSHDLSENTAPNVVLPCNFSNGNICIMRLNPANGNTIWLKGITGVSGIEAKNMKVKGNDVYLIGVFNGQVDFDPGVGVDTLNSDVNTNMFLTKLDVNGNYSWTKSWGTQFDEINGYDMAIDSLNQLYIVGDFYNQVDFDPSISGTYNLSTQSTCRDAYILKLNSNGQFVWAKHYPSETYSSIQTVNLLNNSKSLVMTGAFYGYFDHNPDPTITMMDTSVNNIADPFITMVDTSGKLISFKKYNVGPYGSVNVIKTITDAFNNYYVCGTSSFPIDFDFNADSLILGNNNSNAFVAKYNLLNELFWAKMSYSNSSATFKSICHNGTNSLLLHGTFDGSLDNNLDNTINYTNPSLGYTDVMLTQLDNCYLGTQTVPVTACKQYNLESFSYSQPTTVSVSYSSAMTCDSVVNYQINIITPNVNVTQTANVLTSLATGSTFQWFNCGTNSIIPSATGSSYVANANGSYAVIVTQNGCSDTSICHTVSGLKADSHEYTNSISVFPNPSFDEVTISLDKSYQNVDVQVYDILGRKLDQIKVNNRSKIQLKLPVQSGQYILKMMFDGEIKYVKVRKN